MLVELTSAIDMHLLSVIQLGVFLTLSNVNLFVPRVKGNISTKTNGKSSTIEDVVDYFLFLYIKVISEQWPNHFQISDHKLKFIVEGYIDGIITFHDSSMNLNSTFELLKGSRLNATDEEVFVSFEFAASKLIRYSYGVDVFTSYHLSGKFEAVSRRNELRVWLKAKKGEDGSCNFHYSSHLMISPTDYYGVNWIEKTDMPADNTAYIETVVNTAVIYLIDSYSVIEVNKKIMKLHETVVQRSKQEFQAATGYELCDYI